MDFSNSAETTSLDRLNGLNDAHLEGIVEASQPFVGQWNRLISTTNWEKGKIISEWRTALSVSNAAVTEFSDEAWAKLVGGVTSQHVGRLRRVYHRFGGSYDKYAGLYWSHFQAAVDWDDAELWLEGAVQNDWSVTGMREKRWETLGAVATDKPREEDIIVSEIIEEVPALEAESDPRSITRGDSQGASEPTDGQEVDTDAASEDGARVYADANGEPMIQFVRPFADLPELPPDLAEAFESFKLALLRYKTDGWRTVSCDDVLACLDALKELATAPSSEDATF